MNTAVLPTPIPPPPSVTAPRPVKWTCEDFYLMGGLPSVRDRKVMLIDGEVLEMAAPSERSSITHQLVDTWVRVAFPVPQFTVRTQLGLYFGINTDPVPDVAVLPGDPRNYSRHPGTALLIIEIADTSIAFDTGDKASLYAAAGIADYWVIDVNDRRLHLFRDPQPDPTRKYGHGYAAVQILGPRDTVAPLAAPAAVVTVIDLLP